MRILKARGTSIPLSELTFSLTKDQVIDVSTPIIPHEIPAIDTETNYTAGVEIVDKVVEVIPRGSQVLLITEPGLDSLAPMLSIIIPLVSRYGGPAIIRSYTKSPDEIKRFISQLSKQLKANLDKVLSEIEVVAVNPTTLSLQELAALNARIDSSIKPKFIGVHGLNMLLELYPNVNTYLANHLNNVLLRRKLGITGFYTFSADIGTRNIPGIDIYDIVVCLQRIEEHGEEYYKVTMLRHPTKHRFKTIKLRPHEVIAQR